MKNPLLGIALALSAAAGETTVSIAGEDFLINGRLTYAGRRWNGHRVEGLLFNNRVVQGTFDDLNPETGHWHLGSGAQCARVPRRHARMEAHAVPACLHYQLPRWLARGRFERPPWENHPFHPDGSLRPAFLNRKKRILDEADPLGIVPIVGYFYFGQFSRLKTDEGAIRATDALTKWLLDGLATAPIRAPV